MSKSHEPLAETEITGAPISCLLAGSSSGKTRISNAILELSKGTSLEGKIEIWGYDQELLKQYTDLGPLMFGGDLRFTAMVKKNYPMYELLSAIWGEDFRDPISNKSLSLDDADFEKNLATFLANTENRYDRTTLTGLKEMAQEEKEKGLFKAAYAKTDDPKKITQDAISHAVANSKKGIATVLDGVPIGFMYMKNSEGKLVRDPNNLDIIERLGESLQREGFSGQKQVALIHVHPETLLEWVGQRNAGAAAAGGDAHNHRGALTPLEHWSSLFGKPTNGVFLDPPQYVSGLEILKVAEKFALNQDDVAKVLNVMGLDGSANSVEIGAKVRADVILDHAKQTTAEIASQIFGFILENMGIEASKGPGAVSWVARVAGPEGSLAATAQAGGGGKKSWQQRLAKENDDNVHTP